MAKFEWEFKKQKTLQERYVEAQAIIQRQPGHIPVILQRAANTTIPKLPR
jgi:hypothetical protein